ncbi:hypothetical protein A2U01_0001928 [Trifolium medium]|uniref:Aspartic peptidase DDI1-type domain-containing protein n=1 Tax=Trifolium medium TaxID=97028 RepID=A0A392M1C9_9FABA|nr:hypothetical protein [Trifolium medium]
MCQNEYNTSIERSSKQPEKLDLDKETAYKVEIELLKRKLAEKTKLEENISKVHEVCDFCQENHPNGHCTPGGDSEESPTEGAQHNPQPRKPSPLEETLNKFITMSESNFEAIQTTVTNQGASIKNLETQIGQLSKLVTTFVASDLTANTVDNPKSETFKVTEGGVENKINEIEEGIQRSFGDLINFQVPVKDILMYTPTRKGKELLTLLESFRSIKMSALFGTIVKSEEYERFMQELLLQKEDKSLSKECTLCLRRKLPPKLKDPGKFTISCSIGHVKFIQALCDLGSSINLMPLHMVQKLNIGEPKITNIIELTLADNSVTNSCGMLEDVLVKIQDLVFLVDFVILDVKKDKEIEIILGRPFLATSQAFINVKDGEPMLIAGEEKRIIKVYKEPIGIQCYKIDVQDGPNEVSSLSIQEWPDGITKDELEEEMAQLTIDPGKKGLPPDISSNMAKLTLENDTQWVRRWGKHRKVASRSKFGVKKTPVKKKRIKVERSTPATRCARWSTRLSIHHKGPYSRQARDVKHAFLGRQPKGIFYRFL